MSGAASVVTFDPVAWVTRYPEFSTCPAGQAQLFFNEATLYLGNACGAPVQDLVARAVILNMITAHIAALYFGVNNKAPSGLVGRISDATKGSVHVGVDMGAPPSGSQAWFQQTQYGASAWAAMAPYRRGRYVPGFSACGGGYPLGYGYGYSGGVY